MATNDLFPLSASDERPTSKLEDDDLISRCKSFMKRAGNHSAAWREEAYEDFDFLAGRQWAQEDLAALEEAGRPAITFNRTAPVIEAVAGSQVNNRQEIRFLPRSMLGDEALAENATRLVDWMDDACDAEDELSHAFTDCATCGMGWTDTVMDYSDDPEGVITTTRVDPLEMYWDPNARKRNLADAKEKARVKRWRLDDVIAEWPESKDELNAHFDARDMDSDAWRGAILSWREPGRDYEETNRNADHIGARLVDVICYVWCERRPYRLVVNPLSGQRELVSEADYGKLEGKLKGWAEGEAGEDGKKPGKDARAKAKAMMGGMRSAKQTRNVWFRAFICGDVVLERSEAPVPEMDQFRCITGKMDRNTGLFYGLMRAMKDPQRFANKWLSQATHLVNTTSLGGWVAERSVVDNVDQWERDKNVPGSTLWLKDGGLNRIRERTLGAFPAGQERLLQFAIGTIPDVTGINKEILGMADREQAGVLEAQRKQAAQAILAPLFDSLRRHYKERGRLMYMMLVRFIPPDRQIRVLGEGGQVEVASPQGLPKEGLAFDVSVDEAPTSPNAKMEAWASLQPILPALMKMPLGMGFWGEILKFSPVPESAQAKIRASLMEGAQQQAQPPPPDPKVELEGQKIQVDAQLRQAELALKERELSMKEREAEAAIQANMFGPPQAQPGAKGPSAPSGGGGGPMGALNGVSITLAPEQQEALIMSQQQAQQATLAMLSEMQGSLAQVLQQQQVVNGAVRVLTAPKRVLRGPDGRVAGVEPILTEQMMAEPVEAAVERAAGPRMLVRGPDGRASGVE